MKLKFTRKTWYFFLLAAAAMSMLGGFAVLGGMDFSGLALVWPGLLAIEYGHGRPIQRPLQLVCISEALRLLFWLLTKYAGMSALAFWTNIMFVLLACARGWAALVLYKTQEETL